MAREKDSLATKNNDDFGFGARVIQDSKLRLLNQDGTFNVCRQGLPFFQSLSLYNTLLNMPWWQFYLSLIGIYSLAITAFATGYFLIGAEALSGIQGSGRVDRFFACFFFSVHTITTVGYGHISPNGVLANVLVTIEAFIGLAGFAIAAALIFARFSRPRAKIMFSRNALIGSYHGMPSFMFRIANGARSELVEVEARVLLSMKHAANGIRTRRFYELGLEKTKSAFFPVDWVVVHPITQDSPLHNISQNQFRVKDAEFLVLINAIDDTFSQDVHARSSYRWEEMIWDARFKDMYRKTTKNGEIAIDLSRLDEIEKINTPPNADQTVWDF